MIVTAQDAHKISTGEVVVSKSRLSYVCDYIIEAAQEGRHFMYWWETLDDNTYQQLRSLGYVVEYDSNDLCYEISW